MRSSEITVIICVTILSLMSISFRAEERISEEKLGQPVKSEKLLVFSNDACIPNFPAKLACDGKESTSWKTGSNKAFLQVIAQQKMKIHKLELVFPDSPREIPGSFSIYANINNKWQKVAGKEKNQQRKCVFIFDKPITSDSLRYLCKKNSSYTRGLSEFNIFSDNDPGKFPQARNVTNLASIYTSHRRWKGGDVSKAVDGNINTFWHAGPYAHLFLRFGNPIRITKVCINFGEQAIRCPDYLIQARENGRWRTVKEVNRNDNIENIHIFTPFIAAEGIRFIPLSTAQISSTDLSEIEVYSYDSPKPYVPSPDEWAESVKQKNRTRTKPFGIYAVDHWRDFFPLPEGLFIDGVEYYALWKDIEPQKGKFNWAPIDEVLYECGRHNQKVILKFLTGEQCPEWIFKKEGVPKVVQPEDLKKLKTTYDPPVYWNDKYLKLFFEAIHSLGKRYDGNTNIDSVIMSLAGTGEMGKFWVFPHSYWEKAGYTDMVFVEACKKIIDAYCENFKKTPLICQISYIGSTGSATPALLVAQYAAEKGVMVEQATLDDFMSSSMHKHKSVKGDISFVDIYRMLKGKTGLSTEANAGFVYNQGTDYPARFPEVLWQSLLNSLELRAEHISIYPGDLLRPEAKEIVEFARRRLGKGVADTPSVWINFRGEPLSNPAIGIELVEGTVKTIAPSSLIEKKLCRRTDLKKKVKFMELKIDPKFLGKNNNGLKARVIYLDSGDDDWTLCYREKGQWVKAPLTDKFNIDPDHDKTKVIKENTGKWKEAVFIIPQLDSEANTQLKINAGTTGDEYIHFLEVSDRHTKFENILNNAL